MVGGGETGSENGKIERQFSCQLLPHPPTLQQGISGCRSNYVYFVQSSIILSGWRLIRDPLNSTLRQDCTRGLERGVGGEGRRWRGSKVKGGRLGSRR